MPEPSTGEVEARDAEGTEMKMISGIAVAMASAISQTLELSHCALMGRAVNQWVLDVKCRPRNWKQIVIWESLSTACPGAKVEVKHNDVKVTLPPLEEAIEMAVFGTPGEKDMKRMQMGIFGCEPEKGKDWLIYIVLYDDTIIASQQVREKHQHMGNKLLTARAGLFVSNSDDDIKIELSGLEEAWQIKESTVKVITSKEAWKPPKNDMDFPTCIFEISHIDEMKLSFFCKITASHVADNAKAEVMAVFKQDAEAIEVKANRKDLEESKHPCDELVFTSSQSEKEIPKTPKLRKQMTTKLHLKIPRVFYILTVILVLSCDLCHALDSIEPGTLETVNDKNKQQVSIRGCNVKCYSCLDVLRDGTPCANVAEILVNESFTWKPCLKEIGRKTRKLKFTWYKPGYLFAAATTEKEQSTPITNEEEGRDLNWLHSQGAKEKRYRGISFMFDVLITAIPKENASIYAKHQGDKVQTAAV